MGKKVLILSGSPRRNGNSDTLCDRFMAGAAEAGCYCEKIFVRDMNIAPCLGCYYCEKTGGECAQRDDMEELLQKMIDFDVLVLASPVYFYSVNSQIKTVIDRSVARYTEIRDKELYYILTAAEDKKTTFDGALTCFHGFASCLPGAVEKGVVTGGGAFRMGEIMNSPAMDKAFDMGKSV